MARRDPHSDRTVRARRRKKRVQRSFTAVVEKCAATRLYVGHIPGFPGAHSQGATLDELQRNLREVVAMLLEDGEPRLEGGFVGTQLVEVS
jgi:predicted RNase H-like HicB family nuclease